MKFNTVSVVGLGYIGLPTAAVLASRKIDVIGIDTNQHVVDTINKGEVHISEPDLDMVVHATVKEGYLRATTIPESADAFLIAVPTPFMANHEPDLSYIKSAAESIAPILEKGNLIILESTSPVGATEKMSSWLESARPDLSFPHTAGEHSDIRISHCPERVLPGHVLRELVQNDRVVGGITPKCSEYSVELYKMFVEGECVVTNARTAELVKLTENSFRDVNIAFANELSIISDKLDIDVWELIQLANRHPRVNILKPGPGVGGHCIAVDPWFIVSQAPNESKLIQSARHVNDSKPQWVVDKVKTAIHRFLIDHSDKKEEDVVVACYGLAFKPDIDDLRESPALNIAHEILNMHSGSVLIVEPNIPALPAGLSDADLTELDVASKCADIHVLLVAHKSFKLIEAPKGTIIDTQGIW